MNDFECKSNTNLRNYAFIIDNDTLALPVRRNVLKRKCNTACFNVTFKIV